MVLVRGQDLKRKEWDRAGGSSSTTDLLGYMGTGSGLATSCWHETIWRGGDLAATSVHNFLSRVSLGFLHESSQMSECW